MDFGLLNVANILPASLPVLSMLGYNGAGLNLTGLNVPRVYEQFGPVYNGPGSRVEHQSFMLIKPDVAQRDAIERAKKYAIDQSIKSAFERQTKQTMHQLFQLQQPQQPISKPLAVPTTNKKQQTLTLLCRIYVGSIAYDLKEESIRAAFNPFGPIRSVSLSWDQITQKHKGFAFIEYENPESAQLAVEQMNNSSLGGRQLKVGRPSNLPKAEPLIDEMIDEYQLQKRIFVSGVHYDLSDEDLALVFEAFGKIVNCKLTPDPTKINRHRGFGYVEYETDQAATDAIASMNLFDLGGQLLRVGKAIAPPEGAVPVNGPTTAVPKAAAVAAASATAKVMALGGSGSARLRT